MALSTSSLLLMIYVGCETVRANYAYYAFHNFPQISASLIALFSEIFKLSIALIFLVWSDNGISVSGLSKSIQSGDMDFKRILRYALPAALYLINNLIYYTVLPKTTPSLLQVCMLAKLPTTGIFHHYMLKPQKNVFAWVSLLFLCIGLVIFNIPSESSGQDPENDSAWYLAPIAGFAIACLSALASISAETSIKTGDFWESQAYLYVWGIVFAIVAYPLVPANGTSDESAQQSFLFGVGVAIIGLVVITATTGIVVAVVLRAKDNILKVIGTAASLITIAASQYLLLPELRASTFTPWRVCGGGIVTVSTWCYNHYSQEPWPPKGWSAESTEETNEAEAVLLSEEDAVEEKEPVVEEAGDTEITAESSLFQPTPTKIMACAIAIGFITMEVAKKN